MLLLIVRYMVQAVRNNGKIRHQYADLMRLGNSEPRVERRKDPIARI